MEFQTCWARENEPTYHATYSGDRTVCGLSIISALPVYMSHLEDVTCRECRESLIVNAIESENN